ncbi:MAG: TIGR03032 family protein [Luteibaculum sp.]
MGQAPQPFASTFSPQVPELLKQLNCTIALSTYQAGKLIFISAQDDERLIQLPRSFEKAMGIAENPENGQLALATKDEVILFANDPSLAAHYPKAPGVYDALYLPRCTYHTSALDLHDIAFGAENKIYCVNTLFSSIVTIDQQFNFNPFWKPSFITRLASEDCCHLNGMAIENGRPKYATAFSTGNTMTSWRETVPNSGVLFDVKTDSILTEGLAMPHSPRIINGELYCLLSATGELIKIDRDSGKKTTVKRFDGFVRGMSFYQDYLFVGLSKLRRNSSIFAKLDFPFSGNTAGIVIMHLPTESIVGKIVYQTSVDEIYDVHILAGKSRPNILNKQRPEHKMALSTPNASFWAKNQNPTS